MVNSLFRYVSMVGCLLFSSLTLQAATLEQQRNYFDQAKEGFAKNDPSIYYNYKNALQGYPLEPYLAYLDLNKRVKLASDNEIIQFVKKHSDLPQARWLEMRWLRLVAERGDWNTFLKYYKADSFSELDCYYGQYLYQTNKITEANQLAKQLWLRPTSQPNACDVVFEEWQKQGKLSTDMRWQRLKLVVEAREYRLANYLVGTLPASLTEQGKQFVYVAKNPSLLTKKENFQGTDKITTDIVSLGLRRLARQDPEQALPLLEYYGTRLKFSNEQKVALANDIGLTFARRYDPRALPILAKYDANLDHDDVSEWHVRVLLRLGRWQQAKQLIDRLPEQLAQTNRWRYWKIRVAQQLNPNDPTIKTQYSQLAKERDFYGFLAAQRIKAPYQLNHQPIIVNNNMVLKIRNTPAIQRTREYLYKEMDSEAWIEWHNLTRQLSKQEMLALSQLAYDMNLYFYAIRTLAITSYWDDLTIRFPIAYKDILVKEANNRGISPNWAFAIMRQESAFNHRIKSHAGAMGLMQLMPATARETAKKFDIPLAKTQDALEPDTNIKLGTAFLGQMYQRFQNNRILASAAYNAGPGRVRQWLRSSDNVDFDVWIETIPFNETRQYVQSVLFYSVIYGQKLNQPQPLIENHEMTLTQN